jgi:hypothetical protein
MIKFQTPSVQEIVESFGLRDRTREAIEHETTSSVWPGNALNHGGDNELIKN